MYDLNDAQPQMPPVGELIPDGTFARVAMTIRPGGLNGATPADAGVLKASNTSDAKLLDCEFTVVEGPYARRKFWQNFTVAGGKLDEKGQSKGWNIAKSAFRAMIDSALGLNPKDDSAAAKQKRVIQGLKQLDGIVFVARIMIEPASNPNYKDANKLANVVTPDEPQYAAVMRGESVPPEPVNAKPRKVRGRRHGARLGDAGSRRAGDPTAPGPPAAPGRQPRCRRPRQLPLRPAPGLAEGLMTADEWQAFVTREAAMEIGRWLEGRGRLAAPVSALTLADLEAMASVAICRFVLLGSERIRAQPEDSADLSRLLLG